MVGSSCVACLAHLAILYEVVCRTDPTAGFEMYESCDSALERLGTITSDFQFNEYTYHDLLLGVRPSLCLLMRQLKMGDRNRNRKKSLLVFNARIANLPFKQSETLRYHRKIIGDKFSDFQTRLNDCEPPPAFSLSMAKDGTTKGSKCPNLITVRARSTYGI